MWRQYCIERLMIGMYWLLKALYYFKIVISLGLVKLANNCLLQISFDCGIEFPEKWSGIYYYLLLLLATVTYNQVQSYRINLL